ncbi:MAG: cysteine hydrolase family protein [Polyangiales bacterium]
MAKSHHVAVLLVDVVNAFSFEGSEPLVRAATRVVPNIAHLIARARREGVPVVYVNDNFGQWRSDFRATVAACSAPGVPGRRVTQALLPQPEDFFVLKPAHSGFFCTTLELLLDDLGVNTLVIAGFAANLCVLFTANDAHMLGYHLEIPRDCTASNRASLTRAALVHARETLSAGTPRGQDVRFDRFGRGRTKSRRTWARAR